MKKSKTVKNMGESQNHKEASVPEVVTPKQAVDDLMCQLRQQFKGYEEGSLYSFICSPTELLELLKCTQLSEVERCVAGFCLWELKQTDATIYPELKAKSNIADVGECDQRIFSSFAESKQKY